MLKRHLKFWKDAPRPLQVAGLSWLLSYALMLASLIVGTTFLFRKLSGAVSATTDLIMYSAVIGVILFYALQKYFNKQAIKQLEQLERASREP
jgi:hypothetical protein